MDPLALMANGGGDHQQTRGFVVVLKFNFDEKRNILEESVTNKAINSNAPMTLT
jgi:hypothetical protein